MTAIAPYVRVIDVNLNTQVASTTALLDWAITWNLDAPGTLMVEVPLGDAVATAMIAAAGGPNGSGPILPYLLELSLDGGTNVDARKMIEHPVTTSTWGSAGVREDGPDLFAGYTTTGVDHVSFYNCSLSQVLNGPGGSINVNKPPFITTFLWMKGFYQTVFGNASWAGKYRLAFVPRVDPGSGIDTIPLTVDMELDTIDHATQVVVNGAAGLYNPADTQPFGSRCHFVADTSDAGLNLTSTTQGIGVCYAGKPSGVTFYGGTSSGGINEASESLAIDIIRTPDLATLYAQAAFRGGSSTHGLPDGGSISGLAVINTTTGGTAWNASLLIVAVTTGGNGSGGLFYFPHDGALHRFSPNWDVQALCTNGDAIYAGTPFGVFQFTGTIWAGSATTLSSWPEQGKLSANVTSVWYADDGLHAIVSGSGSQADAVYRYTPGTGDDIANSGYAGWTKQVQAGGSIIGAAGGGGGILYADSNDNGAVTIGATRIPIPDASAVIGVDAYSGYIFVRTAAGASGCYIYDSGSLANLNGDNTLIDQTGNPVMVNKIIPYVGALWNGPAHLIACTDQGLFASPNPLGSQWVSVNYQNGLGDTSVNFVAGGQPQTLLTRTPSLPFVYAANANQLYVSRTAGLYAYELLSAPLDMGPAWQAAARQAGLYPYADNSIGGLSSGSSGGYSNSGGSGTVTTIPPGQPSSMPQGFVWARRLDEHNDWTYRIVDTMSGSPYNAWMPSDLTELQTNALVGAITASGRVFICALRWLGQANKAQTLFTWSSYFITQAAALRRLRPTMSVALSDTLSITGPTTTTSVFSYAGTSLYCLQWTIRKSANGDAAECTGQFGTLLQTQRLTPEQVAADLTTKIKNLTTFGGPR